MIAILMSFPLAILNIYPHGEAAAAASQTNMPKKRFFQT